MAETHDLSEMKETDDDLVQFFKDFLFDDKNKDVVNMLRCVVRELRNGLGSTVLFVRVTGANASMFADFQKATIEAEVLRSESIVPIVAPFAVFFLRGYLTLAEFVHKKRPKLPTNKLAQEALQDLLQFLTDSRERQKKSSVSKTKSLEQSEVSLPDTKASEKAEVASTEKLKSSHGERSDPFMETRSPPGSELRPENKVSDWLAKSDKCRSHDESSKQIWRQDQELTDKSALTAINTKEKTQLEVSLAVSGALDLLVPLAQHKTFVTDCCPGLQLKGCCPDELPVDGNEGDTSFGCHKGWHGRADILLMGDNIPITVVVKPEDAGDIESVSVSSDTSVEVNEGDYLFSSESISQIIAQTIVHSFVQNRKNPKSLNTMLPGIGICAEQLVINLYDSVEDILVTTGLLDIYAIYAGSNLNVKAIVMLWFALNQALFGNKTPEKYRKYTAKFHDVMGPEHLNAYKNESEQPFIAKSEEANVSRFMQDLNLNRSDGLEDVNNYVTETTHSSYLLT